MEVESQRPMGREGTISALNTVIEVLDFAREVSTIAPAEAVFGSASATLVMIRDAMINQADYVELGLACADVCTTLDRGLDGKRLSDLNDSVCQATNQLTTAVAEIQENIIEQRKRNAISQHPHTHIKNDRERIAAWKLDLVRILQVFNTELAINTHVAVSGTHPVVSERGQSVSDINSIVSENHRTVAELCALWIHQQTMESRASDYNSSSLGGSTESP